MEGNINARIRAVRKATKLAQTEFGERIGLTKNAVVNMEIPGRAKMSDAYILAICREFNVRETWLRTGEGEMYEKPDAFSVDALIASSGLQGKEAELVGTFVRMFCDLKAETRRDILERFAEYFGEAAAPEPAPPRRNVHEWTREEQDAAYKRQADAEDAEREKGTDGESTGSRSASGGA